MANIRVKDLPNTDTLVDGDELIVDSSSAGTRRVSYAEVKTEIAADYVAAPSTYKVATLAADNKLDPSQIPDTISGGYNFVGVANNVGDLTSTTQGDFYVIQTAFGAYSVGDRAVYDGSAYVRVTDGTVLIAEGGTGAITAADARTNLSVNSKDEDAEANGTKLLGPSVYFDGSNDYVEVADNEKLSFTDGTDDLPFTIGGFLSLDTLPTVRYTIASKYGASSTEYEFWLYIDSNGYVNFRVSDTAGNYEQCQTAASVPVGSTFHLAVTYGGSGPNSDSAFISAFSQMSILFNGVAQPLSDFSSGTYTGMSDTTESFKIGQRSGVDYLKGHIRNVRIFNRELTAAEVADLARGNELGFADEWGDHTANIYTGDSANFASSLGNWIEYGSTSITVAQSGGVAQITNTAASTGGRGLSNPTDTISEGKRYRMEFTSRVSSGTGQEVRIRSFNWGAFGEISNAINGTTTANFFRWTPTGTTTKHSFEFVTQGGGSTDYLVFDLANNTGNGEVYDIDDVKVVPIGTLADFRSERFDSSLNKWYDLSDSAFVGTNNGATLVGREVPVYTTGSWTPSLYFSGTSAATYSAQSGYYTRIGNTVYVRGSITVSGVGASSGDVSVVGLPFTPSADGASSSVAGCYMTSAANLTSQPIGLVGDGVSQIELYDAGATGNTALDETNITASSIIKVSATYQIQ